jgi:hypothetical protein
VDQTITAPAQHSERLESFRDVFFLSNDFHVFFSVFHRVFGTEKPKGKQKINLFEKTAFEEIDDDFIFVSSALLLFVQTIHGFRCERRTEKEICSIDRCLRRSCFTFGMQWKRQI